MKTVAAAYKKLTGQNFRPRFAPPNALHCPGPPPRLLRLSEKKGNPRLPEGLENGAGEDSNWISHNHKPFHL